MAFVRPMSDTGYMSLTLHQIELGAHNESIRLQSAELVGFLRAILGAQLVAYIAGVTETRAVREWAEGVRRPRPTVLKRLRTAYQAAAIIEHRESRATVQAWFQGLNPSLDDRSPARVLRDGNVEQIGGAVLAAARSFANAA